MSGNIRRCDVIGGRRQRTLRDGVYVVLAVAEAGDVVLDTDAAAQLLFHCERNVQPSVSQPAASADDVHKSHLFKNRIICAFARSFDEHIIRQRA